MGKLDVANPQDDDFEAVKQALAEVAENPNDDLILYFRTDCYHEFATDAYKIGAHYFSYK